MRQTNAVTVLQFVTVKVSLTDQTVLYLYIQRSFISQMECAPFKCLFWNINDSIANLTISFTSGVSLWDRPC